MKRIGACLYVVAWASSGGLAQCTHQNVTGQIKVARLQQLLATADSEMRERKFADAANHYADAVCVAPDSAPAQYGLGVSRAAMSNFIAARKSLQEAERLDASNPLPLAMQVRVNIALNDPDAVRANLIAAAKRFRDNGELHSALARLLAENSLLDLALAESLRARKAGSRSEDATLGLAVLENSAGAYNDAVRNATAIEQDTKYADVFRASAAGIAGLSDESLGRRDDAIRELREAIRLDPSRENSYVALAFLYEKSSKYNEAVQILQAGRQNLPDSLPILLALGTDLIRSEAYSEGIPILRSVLQQSPEETDAYMALAEAYRNTNNPKEETQILQELAQKRPDFPMIHVLIARAMINVEAPDYKRVLDELAAAERNSPADPDVFYLRGKAYVQLKRNEEAVRAFRRAIELRPLDSSAYYQLARLYQTLGQKELAKQQFERVKYLQLEEVRPQGR